jgi:hypothetical protein
VDFEMSFWAGGLAQAEELLESERSEYKPHYHNE